MNKLNVTGGEWYADNDGSGYISSDGKGVAIAVSDEDALLMAQSKAMYETIESLIGELNHAIDEVNTMRDIRHTDNFTPADHWDKESLFLAEKLLAKARGEV